ncbi:hypothetical protein JW766_05765 [Candidatus Dojkabacteria bacterium]|nr:hypothetical protein [Candidatus Dojkabacteria bacterium]
MTEIAETVANTTDFRVYTLAIERCTLAGNGEGTISVMALYEVAERDNVLLLDTEGARCWFVPRDTFNAIISEDMVFAMGTAGVVLVPNSLLGKTCDGETMVKSYTLPVLNGPTVLQEIDTGKVYILSFEPQSIAEVI